MRAIEAVNFSGYGGLRQFELPKPQPAKDSVLVRITAAGVTPLDHTILSGGHPRAKAPLVLGSEGAGVVEDARTLGFDEVIDLSTDKLGEGVRRITQGYGSDIVIDAIGGDILSEALGTLAVGGSLTTLGYSASRKSTIDVTDLIWKRASIKSFSLFAQP